jgi:hypothetical protein
MHEPPNRLGSLDDLDLPLLDPLEGSVGLGPRELVIYHSRAAMKGQRASQLSPQPPSSRW